MADIEQACRERAAELELGIDFRQSNHERPIIDRIQEARQHADGIVINAGALTRTSVTGLDALHLDALHAAEIPTIEVHLSNVHRREAFRRHSDVSGGARGVIAGPGSLDHASAPDALARWSADAHA